MALTHLNRPAQESDELLALESRMQAQTALKASKIQGDWITPTLLNGVTSVGGIPIQYMKDEFGFVFLKGWAVVAVNGTTMLTLPVGYRPSISKRFPSVNTVSSGSIRVNSDGSVIFESGNTSSTPLDSIHFKEGS